MPTPLVKKYADMYDVSVNKAEKEWNDSFDIAKDEYGDITKRKSNRNKKIFGTTTNIFKNKMKKKYGDQRNESNKIIYSIMRLKKFNENDSTVEPTVKGVNYKYSEIEVFANDNEYSITEYGRNVIGSNFIVLEHDYKDKMISYVLTGTSNNSYIYECVYSDIK